MRNIILLLISCILLPNACAQGTTGIIDMRDIQTVTGQELQATVYGAREFVNGEVGTLKVVLKNRGNHEVTINDIDTKNPHRLISCDKNPIPPGHEIECLLSITPQTGTPIDLTIYYRYNYQGSTRTEKTVKTVTNVATIKPILTAQAYRYDVYGDCENTYYSCEEVTKESTASVGYKCMKKEGYYIPATARVDLGFDLSTLPQEAQIIYARIKIYASNIATPQDYTLNTFTPFTRTSCTPEGDICDRPYCSECQTLYENTADTISTTKITSFGYQTFDATEEIKKAKSTGNKAFFQVKGKEDLWNNAGQSSCQTENKWTRHDVEFHTQGVIGPVLEVTYYASEPEQDSPPTTGTEVTTYTTTTNPLGFTGGDICTDCCKLGETECTITCQSGTATLGMTPKIVSCEYDGTTVKITGTGSIQMACTNGQCGSGTVTTSTSTVTSTSSTTSTTTPESIECRDGTPVGQCSDWFSLFRCVLDSSGKPRLVFDLSCIFNPNPTTTTTTTTQTTTTMPTTTTITSTSTTVAPTTTTTSSSTTTNPTTSTTTTTTGPDNCQSDTDCINKYGGCYVCPYKGAECSKGLANCETNDDCSDYGSDWKCVNQCCMPPGTTTTTTPTTTTVTPTTTTTSTSTVTTSASTSTVTSSTTTSTIDVMNIVWVSEGYSPGESGKFVELAKAAEAYFLTKYPVKDCSNPAERVKFYYITPDKCDATCDVATEVCTGCVDNARECVKNNGLSGIYDKFVALIPTEGTMLSCSQGIPGDGASVSRWESEETLEFVAAVASHELGHTYGLCHVPLCNAQCGTDCSWCPNYADIQDPKDWDIMTYCNIDEKFGPTGYEHLKSEFKKCIIGC